MMKNIIDEMLEKVASEMRKDGAFEEFRKQIMKDEGFVEFLKQKGLKRDEECDCVRCTMPDKIVDLINNDIQKQVDDIFPKNKENIMNLYLDEKDNGNIETIEKEREQAEKILKKAVKKYTDDTIVFFTMKKAKENSNG